MRNIKNLKDPTGWLAWPQIVFLIAFMLIACRNVVMVESYGYQGRLDSANAETLRENVTCIAHDTKFTCDCQNANVPLHLPNLEGFVYQIEIQNCKSLTIEANAMDQTQGLRKITLKNIDNLVLNKYALVYPRFSSNAPLIIEFNKVNFELIDSHAINGNIEEIYFIDSRIRVINPFGFTTLKERATLLRMHNVVVDRIEQQAFKKFAVDQLEITNSIFNSVPSKAFYELEVLTSLRIDNCRFKDVHTRGFSFRKATKLSITNNIFEEVDAEWIGAYVKENVMIQNNYFGITNEISFKALSVHPEYILSQPLELRFLNNTITMESNIRPLQFNEKFQLIISQLQYDNEYVCKDLDSRELPPKPNEPFFRAHTNSIYMHRAAANNAVSNNQSYVALSKIIELDCQKPSYLLYILLGVLLLLFILLLIGGIVCWQLSKRRKRHKLDMIMPEPRTYKETQIVYQIENAGLLKTDL